MIGQDALEPADACVTDGYARSLARPCPWRLGRASLRVGGKMRRMRNKPQGRGREPVSEGGTAHVRSLGELPATRTAFKQPDVEAGEFDELFAIWVRGNIAKGGQESSRCRLADSGELPQELVGRSMCKEGDGLVEPEGLCGPGIAQVAGEGFALELVEAISVLETEAGGGKGIEAVEGLRPPRPAATTGRPLFQAACTAVAPKGRWSWMGLQAAESGRWPQGFHEWMECRQCQGDGGAQLMTQLADSCLPGPVPWPQAVSSPELRGAVNGQAEFALEEQVANTVRIFCVGFTGALRHRLAMMADRLAVPETDPVPTAFEPFVEGVPVAPRGLPSAQEASPLIWAQLVLKRRRQAPEARTSVGKFEFAAVHRGLRANTGPGLGLAHLDSHEQQVRLLHVCCTLFGVSARLLQSHETVLLL
jgi:hypothetical protein